LAVIREPAGGVVGVLVEVHQIGIGPLLQQVGDAALQQQVDVGHEDRPLAGVQQAAQALEAHRLVVGDRHIDQPLGGAS
jgi:hypothetical protein